MALTLEEQRRFETRAALSVAARADIRSIRVGLPVKTLVWEARPAAVAAGPGQVQDAGSSGPGRAAVRQVQERTPGQESSPKHGHLRRPARRFRSQPRTRRHLLSIS